MQLNLREVSIGIKNHITADNIKFHYSIIIENIILDFYLFKSYFKFCTNIHFTFHFDVTAKRCNLRMYKV